jgi:hypothetical protein
MHDSNGIKKDCCTTKRATPHVTPTEFKTLRRAHRDRDMCTGTGSHRGRAPVGRGRRKGLRRGYGCIVPGPRRATPRRGLHRGGPRRGRGLRRGRGSRQGHRVGQGDRAGRATRQGQEPRRGHRARGRGRAGEAPPRLGR